MCEAALLPGRGNRRRTCKRSKCKAEFRLRPVLYLPFPGAKTCTSYPPTATVERPLETSIKTGVKTASNRFQGGYGKSFPEMTTITRLWTVTARCAPVSGVPQNQIAISRPRTSLSTSDGKRPSS